MQFPHFRKRRVALLASVATIGMISTLVPGAFAATTPVVTVDIVQKDVAAVVGKGFTARGTATISVAAGTSAGKATTTVRPDGRFAATVFLPANYSGTVKATAKVGTQTATGTTKAGATISTASAPKASTLPKTATPKAATTPKPATPKPATTATGAQKLGVGGVKAPAGAILSKADSTEPLKISKGGSEGKPVVYDGGGHTIGKITIKADWVTVQNFKVIANGRYGIESEGSHITIQNNDIKGIKGPGDLNAITFFGSYHNILYNTAIDFVDGDPGGSHTDAIQNWTSDSHPTGSNYVVIKGNKFSGPSKKESNKTIHQCVMAEGLGRGGNSGGDGESAHWLIADNYFKDSHNQCLKFDGIHDVIVTGNEFAGDSSKVVEFTSASKNPKFYDDNKIGPGYGGKPKMTPGPGPKTLPTSSTSAAD